MKKIIIISLLLLFNACSMPSIKQHGDSINIIIDSQSIIKGEGKTVFKKSIKLSKVYIDQKVFAMNNGSFISFEYATAESSYSFNYGVKRLIGIVFPSYSYNLVDAQGNLFFFMLTNKDEIIYMILENMNKKSIKIIYGFSKNDFEKIHSSILKHTLIENDNVIDAQTVVVDEPSSLIKSKWSEKNIIMDNIIGRKEWSRSIR